MRRLGLSVCVALAVLLQLSLLPALQPFGVVPNLVLVVVVLAGLEGVASATLVAAVAAGLAVDLASGADFGLRTGLLVLVVLVIGWLRRAGIELAGGLVAAVLVTAGTVLTSGAILLSVAGVVNDWPVMALLAKLGLELMINLGLLIMLRPVVQWALYGRRGNVPAG